MSALFTIIFLTAGMILLVAEIIGVKRKGPGDTITENWRWLRDHLPYGWLRWAYRIMTAGILVWALLHLVADVD